MAFTNSTIGGNSATGKGGGLYCVDAQASLKNCIFWNDSAPVGPELALESATLPCSLSASYSDIQGGQSAVYQEAGCTLIWDAGNIDSDPLFARPSDYHLLSGSPCINAGTSTGPVPTDDIDGDPRPRATSWDIGSDEYYEVSMLVIPNATKGLDVPEIPRGSSLGYTIAAINHTASKRTFKYWTTVKLPNGSTYPPSGALFGPMTVTLNPFASRSAHLTQSTPVSAPLGLYTYNCHIGAYPVSANERHFDFEVVVGL